MKWVAIVFLWLLLAFVVSCSARADVSTWKAGELWDRVSIVLGAIIMAFIGVVGTVAAIDAP